MDSLRVTILGCGGSGGVPLVGGTDGAGDWGACDPAEPRNRRSRSSILVEQGGRSLLVDAGPDLRTQCLANRVGRVDAVLFTHGHADHIMGVDDLRVLNRQLGAALPAIATEETLGELRRRFDYAFRAPTPPAFYRPALLPVPVGYGQDVEAAGFRLRALRLDHRVMDVLGIRIGGFAYCTDVVEMPEETLEALGGLDTLVVGCFQRGPHPVHAWVERVLDWVARLRPQRTVLTHMGTDLDWRWCAAQLPEGVTAAWDGRVLEVPG